MLYAILSDIHANYQALVAVETYIKRLKSQLDSDDIHFWFLGDILGYGPEPVECLRWLWNNFKSDPHWVVGNHDQEVVRMAQRSVPTDAEDLLHSDGDKMKRIWQEAKTKWEAYEKPFSDQNPPESEDTWITWYVHSRVLQEDERRWQWLTEKVAQAQAQEAHDIIHVPFDEMKSLLVHGSIQEATRRTTYLYPWVLPLLQMDLSEAQTLHGIADTTVLLHGHSHYPHLASLGDNDKVIFHSIQYGKPQSLKSGVYAINPGSVGQPRDGDPRAAFALLDTDRRTITYYRVMYNVLDSMRKLEEGGYPRSLVERLESADGGPNLARFRDVYVAPRLEQLVAVAETNPTDGASLWASF